jgi:hypothetical protein
MQIDMDRRRITELKLQGYTDAQIRDILHEETGIDLSRESITRDVGIIKKGWLEKRNDNYEALVNKELSRIDSLENEAWRAWRASCKDKEREVVERVARELSESDEEFEMIVSKATTIIDKSNGVGDPRFFDKIVAAQTERRKLLGLYAPAKLGIDIRQRNELVIKGYAFKNTSPDAWPDVVDGEVLEPNKIEG